jgi:hypothetical protein
MGMGGPFLCSASRVPVRRQGRSQRGLLGSRTPASSLKLFTEEGQSYESHLSNLVVLCEEALSPFHRCRGQVGVQPSQMAPHGVSSALYVVGPQQIGLDTAKSELSNTAQAHNLLHAWFRPVGSASVCCAALRHPRWAPVNTLDTGGDRGMAFAPFPCTTPSPRFARIALLSLSRGSDVTASNVRFRPGRDRPRRMDFRPRPRPSPSHAVGMQAPVLFGCQRLFQPLPHRCRGSGCGLLLM